MRLHIILLALAGCSSSELGEVTADAQLDAAPSYKEGYVEILGRKSITLTEVAGAFLADEPPVAVRDDGPCRIALRNRAMTPTVSAGTLTIAGGAGPTVTLSYDPYTGYFKDTYGPSYAANDQLTVSAAGDAVPAFSTQIAFPASVTVTSGTPAILNKSGFTATWDLTTSPVRIRIGQYPSGAPQLSITCVFDGAAGTGMIPASALADVMMGGSVVIQVTTTSATRLMVGEYPTDLTASEWAVLTQVPVQP